MVVSGGKVAAAPFGDGFVMEEEVRMADMESKLREMVIAIARPSIMKIANCKTDMEDIWATLKVQGNQLQEIAAEIQLTSERSNLIMDFKRQLDDSSDRIVRLDANMAQHERVVLDRLEGLEHKNELQATHNAIADRTLQRVNQDFEVVHASLRRQSDALNAAAMDSKHLLNAEVATLKASIGDIDREMQRFQDEVWGPEDCTSEIMPPSLRRVDFQMRKVQSRCADMASDLTALRKLESDMKELSQSQGEVKTGMEEFMGVSKNSREKVLEIEFNTKEQAKVASEHLSTFSAKLMRDVNMSIEHEVRSLQSMRGEMEHLVQTSRGTVDALQRSVDGITAQVDVSFKQLHFDIDGLEMKRRRDKQTVQDTVQGLHGQLTGSLEASASTLRSLEHISSVVSMALQGERIAVAMEVQDYIDRKSTPYVGIRETARCSKAWGKKDGLDPTALARLWYDPKPIDFQGSKFQRAQLCALREKVVHSAQELLLQGPVAAGASKMQKSAEGPPPAPFVPNALGCADGVPMTSRRSSQGISRPGSRSQPSARGSPVPDRGDSRGYHRTTPDSARLHRESGFSDQAMVVQDVGPLESVRSEGTHLPALAASAF